MGCPPSLGSYRECDKGMRDAKGLIRRNWGVLWWRSGLSHLPSPSLLSLQHWTPLISSPREPPHQSCPTTLVIMPQVLAPNSPHHPRHPPQTTREIQKPSPLPLQLTWPFCSCPFLREVPGTLGRNAFSSRKYQFIKTLPKKRSLQTNFSFQKPSGEEKKKKKKRHATF